MGAKDVRRGRAGLPDAEHAAAELGHTQPVDRARKHHVIRSVMRGATLLGGALGATGASLDGHQVIALGTLLVTTATIAGELWIAKRRDDLFSKVATQHKVNPVVLRALTIHEAVRNGLLSSEDTVRLLLDEPDGSTT